MFHGQNLEETNTLKNGLQGSIKLEKAKENKHTTVKYEETNTLKNGLQGLN